MAFIILGKSPGCSMHCLFIFSVLVVGLSGIIAQVLFLRELLVSFYGNELTLGVILANWLICEALGVFLIGKAIDRIKNKINIFVILEIIFSVFSPVSIYLCRTFKGLLGITFAEAIGLYAVFFISFSIILPVSFCHGALFSCLSKIYALHSKTGDRSIGRVYAWETIGTVIGGIILTYLFIPRLNSFQMAFIVSLSNILLCLFFLKETSRPLRYILLFLAALATFVFLSGGIGTIQRLTVQKQWRPQRVLDYRNSIYGNVVVTKQEGQQSFFYNGIPIITTPYPDITFVEEFGNLPLLFHRNPQEILVISGGAGGLINEILKYPVKRADYVELDPLVIEMLEEHPSDLTQKELGDKRVNIIKGDGRFFLIHTPNRYDVVLIGLSRPVDLTINRFFTAEFFSLVKMRMNPGGILAFCLPGSLAYLSPELKDINASVLNGLKEDYTYVRVIPGDYNMFLASDFRGVIEASGASIAERIKQRNIKTNMLVPDYLEYRLSRERQEWFTHSLSGATGKVNRDYMPLAIFQMLVFWNKEFSPALARFLASLRNLELWHFALLIFILSAVLYIFYRRRRKSKFAIGYCIATTGFFGMLINLTLIFSFQIVYGYAYYRIGILISIFMAGIALSSFFINERIERMKNNLNLLIKLEVIIAAFSFLTAWIIGGKMSAAGYWPSGVFSALFFISGALMGLEFPLASKLYLDKSREIGKTAGLLYASDLTGAWVAGVLGGIVFLPVLGLLNTCLIIGLFKLSSVFLIRKLI